MLSEGSMKGSKGNLSLIDEIYSPDFVCHFVDGQEWRGLEGIRQAVASHRSVFPDWIEQIVDIIAQGDRVVTRWISRGTHKGDFYGYPPTGNQVTVAEAAVFRIDNLKIVEQWGLPDQMSLVKQLDVEQHCESA
jgi:predicted ester cyclase